MSIRELYRNLSLLHKSKDKQKKFKSVFKNKRILEYLNKNSDKTEKETTKRFNKYKLNKLLNDLDRTDIYGEVLRAKGIVPIEDGKWIQFDYVPRNVDIKDFKSDYTGRICVIGKNLNKNNLKELFLKERRK